MPTYEYSVIPAPKRGVKGKGIKGGEAQFANALTKVMNEAAAEGWQYMRAETLPSEERQGLTGRTTVFQNMLVFRREVVRDAALNKPSDATPPPLEAIAEPEPLPALDAPEPEPEPEPEPVDETPTEVVNDDAPQTEPLPLTNEARRDA